MSDKTQKQATAKAAIMWWWKVYLAFVCVEGGFSQIHLFPHVLIVMLAATPAFSEFSFQVYTPHIISMSYSQQ